MRTELRVAAAAVLTALAAACVAPGAPGQREANAGPPPEPPTRLTCILQAPTAVALGEPVVPLTFTLRNDGPAAVRVLGRQTPFEGFLSDLFDVTIDGRRLDYLGPVVKRGPPTEAEFLTLAPGAHGHATIDLLRGYDLTAAGSYTVRFVRTEEFACNQIVIFRS
jgi:peptidyl-Lys metalloendopeptidase